MGGRLGGGCLRHTVENRGDEKSGETGLLVKVQNAWDLRSIGVTGSRVSLRVRHGSDMYEEELLRRTRSSLGGGDPDVEKRPWCSMGEKL